MKYLLLVVLLFGCAYTPPTEKKEIGEIAVDSMKPVLELPPKPKPEVNIKHVAVNVKELKGFGKLAETRFRKIAANTEKIINSDEFKNRITTFKYNKTLMFVDTPDSPSKVFDKITSQDWVLEYRLEALRIGSSVIGYTYPSVSWIAFNSRKWSKLSDADISGNICHEYGGHKLGRYSHSMKWNSARDYSAPYGIGNTCKELYASMFN